MKKILTLILSLFALQTFAGPVSPQKALKNAQQLMTDNHRAQLVNDLKLAYRCKRHDNADLSYFYIYNVGNDQGFVIMSGEDNTEDVLGYCEQGKFDINHIPDNLKWWMQYYEEAIKWTTEHQTSQKTVYNAPTDVIEPMVKTKWNQDWPYNDRCPESNGIKCPTGCVATALAQVLYYHKYPNTQTKELPGYQCRTLNKWIPGLPAISFNWDDMKRTYNYYSSQESIDAVALLMQYCGQLVEMGYSPEGSGAQTDIIAQRLPQYFNFPSTIHSMSREGYSIAEWDSLLIYELNHNRPVLYTGYTSAFEGHAFICDGYNGNGLFHINWGWGGVADGYYRISVLDAKGNGIGGSSTSLRFSIMQSALFGIKTEGEDEFVYPTETLTANGRPSLRDGRTYKRNPASKNFTNIGIYYEVLSQNDTWGTQHTHGLNLYDDEGNQVKNIARKGDYFWPQYPNEVEFNVNFGSGLEDGHYTLRPVYSDGSKWVPMAGSDRNYIDVQITGDEMTLTPIPQADFVVSDFRKDGHSIVVTLTNPYQEYNGPLYLCKLNKQGLFELVAFEYVAITPGETRDFYIYLPDGVSLDLNKDVYFLTVDNYEFQYFYSNVVNTDAEIEKEIKVLNLTEDGSTIVGDKAMVDLTLKNVGTGEYHHFINVSLFDEEDKNVSDEFKEVIDIQPGETIRLAVHLPIKDYDRMTLVKATHIVDKNTNVPVESEVFAVEKGAVYWNAKGQLKTLPHENTFIVPEEAVAINLRAAYSTDVKPNSNPNTIYLLNKSVPKGLKGYNIVNFENKSGNIVLKDGYDYYIPETITATNSIKYLRTFNSEECGKWSTLVLPFKPTTMTVDAKAVDWFHDSADTDKEFWIQTINQINDDKVVLQYPDSLATNTPYFISVNNATIGKMVEFYAGKTELQPLEEMSASMTIGDYSFVGTNAHISKSNIFVLNDQRLVYAETPQQVEPFRAYLIQTNGEGLTGDLTLQGPDITDVINFVKVDHDMAPADVFNISGIKLADTTTINSLNKGVYIIKGKKIIIK